VRTEAASGDTYEQARDDLFAKIPDGWRVMHLNVSRDTPL